MKAWLAALGLVALTATATPAAVISFDTTPNGAGGSLLYQGTGGPLFGTDIFFVDVEGIDTPLNSGATFACVACQLDFETGNNLQEGPPVWQWDGGGSFRLHGSIPALGIVDEPLLTGTFTATANTPLLAGGDVSALFSALGVDTKHPALTAFFGLSDATWAFANTEIALGTFVPGGGGPDTGSFIAVPNQADIVNFTAVVPQPAALLLLGLGLLGAGMVRRRS